MEFKITDGDGVVWGGPVKISPCQWPIQTSQLTPMEKHNSASVSVFDLMSNDLQYLVYRGIAGKIRPKQAQSRQISEEWPNVVQSKRFMSGLTCWGPYCDNLLPHEFKSPRLTNSGTCDWTVWSSERAGMWLDCGLGRFVAGLRCRDDYCGEVGLRCCQARVE